jgi:hypothetical protein
MFAQNWESGDNLDEVLIASQQIEVETGTIGMSNSGGQAEAIPDFGPFRVDAGAWRTIDLSSLLSLSWGSSTSFISGGLRLDLGGIWKVSSYVGVSFKSGATSMTWRMLANGSEFLRGSTIGSTIYGDRVKNFVAGDILTLQYYSFGGRVDVTAYNDYYGIRGEFLLPT